MNGRHLDKPWNYRADRRYYRNLETRNCPPYSLYYQCRCDWKLAQWLHRLLNR